MNVLCSFVKNVNGYALSFREKLDLKKEEKLISYRTQVP